MYRVSVEL